LLPSIVTTTGITKIDLIPTLSGFAAIELAVGINTGAPIREDGDSFGTAVILATRACETARGGQIRVTDVLRQLAAGNGFSFRLTAIGGLSSISAGNAPGERPGAFSSHYEVVLPPVLFAVPPPSEGDRSKAKAGRAVFVEYSDLAGFTGSPGCLS
jgi:hypothetical protein